MRGFRRISDRFIPACAGNSTKATSTMIPVPVHPRVRGEQTLAGVQGHAWIGSSPRARGTAVWEASKTEVSRFIPACAGNRMDSSSCYVLLPVHPRVRGEQR